MGKFWGIYEHVDGDVNVLFVIDGRNSVLLQDGR